jgi:transcriptional regulator with XRE-family HTH domain
MPTDDAKAIGRRIRKFRTDKGLTAAQLANDAKISRSYLSELENGKGDHKRPSAQVMYRIGKALGVSMSELLGRPLITEPTSKRNASLETFAAEHRIPDTDVDMLASIRFRGDLPQTTERWSFIYQAIKTSKSLDPPPATRRRRTAGS